MKKVIERGLLFGSVVVLSWLATLAAEPVKWLPGRTDSTITLPEGQDRVLAEAGRDVESAGRYEDVEVSGPGEVVFNRILAVQRANGNIVEFYEPLEGMIFYSEVGDADNRPLSEEIIVDGMQPVDLFKYLMPGTKPPQSLLNAQERAQKQIAQPKWIGRKEQPTGAVDMVPLEDDAPAVQNKHSFTHSGCSVEICRKASSEFGSWTVEWLYRTNTSYFTRNDNHQVVTVVCPYRGNVLMTQKLRPWWTWSTAGTWTVIQGTYRQFSNWNTIDFDFESRVSQAEGDGYHHCGSGKK